MKNKERSAFPLSSPHWADRVGRGITENDTIGLSKREYFAGLALQGLLSLYNNANGVVPNTENVEYMAGLAVTSADALLEALKKSQDTSNPK